mmetsp:Transcript_95865/g.293216  ORF Transcript_95865/g.293216 Transcript_95865/m.293216 type:complete len:244 (+) Transcript_95865:1332-2063(+)
MANFEPDEVSKATRVELLLLPQKLPSSSYRRLGWPCVCSISPRLHFIWMDLARCLGARCSGSSSPSRSWLPLPAGALWATAALVSSTSSASSLSPSMVPTNRPFRLLTDSTREVLGLIQPLKNDFPSSIARTSTLNSTSTFTTSQCAEATAWKRGDGIGGGVVSNGAFSHFTCSSSVIPSNNALSSERFGRFAVSSSFNGLITIGSSSSAVTIVGSSSSTIFGEATRPKLLRFLCSGVPASSS